MKTLVSSLRMLGALSLLTGVLYPLLVWVVAQVAFPEKAEGSLVRRDGVVVGSALLAQPTTADRYFAPRPSAADYATVASGASSQSWTSAKLASTLAARAEAFRTANHLAADAPVPAEMQAASGSGLDPHISPEAARLQVARVAAARQLPVAQVTALVERAVAPDLGLPLVNVLRLNVALDTLVR